MTFATTRKLATSVLLSFAALSSLVAADAHAAASKDRLAGDKYGYEFRWKGFNPNTDGAKQSSFDTFTSGARSVDAFQDGANR